LVNDSESTLIVPMLFVPVVCVSPPKTKLHVPDVVGTVLQFAELDQLPLPAPPVHVALSPSAWPLPIATETIADRRSVNLIVRFSRTST
jgi:hypothetical protein